MILLVVHSNATNEPENSLLAGLVPFYTTCFFGKHTSWIENNRTLGLEGAERERSKVSEWDVWLEVWRQWGWHTHVCIHTHTHRIRQISHWKSQFHLHDGSQVTGSKIRVVMCLATDFYLSIMLETVERGNMAYLPTKGMCVCVCALTSVGTF